MSYFGLYLLDPKRQPWENPNCIGCIMSLYISLKFYNSDIIAFDVTCLSSRNTGPLHKGKTL